MSGNRQVFSIAMNTADRARWDSQWTEATQEYRRALAEFPDDAAARGGLGFCYMQTKQWQQALDEYEHILKRDPSNVIALSKTAELYGILHRREDGYKAYMHLAELYSQAGQGSRAEAAWQKAVQLSPGDPEPHVRLASYYLVKKDVGLMLKERLAAAASYFQSRDLAAARSQCEEVLRVDANNREALQLLSQLSSLFSGPLPLGSGAINSSATGATTAKLSATNSSGPLADTGGGNTGIMNSTGNFGGGGNGYSAGAPPQSRITASQVTGILRQAQLFSTQGRFHDAIGLCEQILQGGFDRPDARYFLGWLYQEQQRWDEAIRQFQLLLTDPDYALSCYYALGQCHRARGDLRTATVHFDEAVDRVNLDALTVEESDQLVQLCQEAAEAHRLLGEQEQALTVYHALLGFLRSRGWNDKVAQVEFMLQQAQQAPARSITPPAHTTGVLPPESTTSMQQLHPAPSGQAVPDAATMAFSMTNLPQPQTQQAPASSQLPASATAVPSTNSGIGELPDWLTGILSDADKTQVANRQAVPPGATPPPVPPTVTQQPTIEQRPVPMPQEMRPIEAAETTMMSPLASASAPATVSWLTDNVPPAPAVPQPPASAPASATWQAPAPPTAGPPPAAPAQPPASATWQPPTPPTAAPVQPPAAVTSVTWQAPAPPIAAPPPVEQPLAASASPIQAELQLPMPEIPTTPVVQNTPAKSTKDGAEDLLSQIAGPAGRGNVTEAVLLSTATLPENVRSQVIRTMQEIQSHIHHGLYNQAIEACKRVIDMAPQYLDVHQVLCEIFVRQGKVESAITKYAILVDTYVVNGMLDEAVATYRRILQLEPNNLTYRMRLISLLSSQGNKEDLLRERTLAAEAYLRLGYMDRALTELEQALQESPTSVPTRLNYGLALQKLGRTAQAAAEYQRVLQVDPRNITALVRWHVAMITTLGASKATALEVLNRVCWQLRGEGQRYSDVVLREYGQAAEAFPQNADVHFAHGQIYSQAGEYDKAIDCYMLAMRDGSVEVMARVSAGHCLLSQGKPEAAIAQFEQALASVRRTPTSIEPSMWAARPREEGEEHSAPEAEISLLLAKAYGRTGRQDLMQAMLRSVKQTTTYQDEVSSLVAEISARRGDTESTLAEYAELVRHYRNSKQTENALNILHEMLRIAPQDPRAHAELGEIHIGRGMLEEGIAELRLLADIQLRRNDLSEAGETLRRIGSLSADMGNMDEALTTMRRAIEFRPDDMDLLREMVTLCWQHGNNGDAVFYQEIIGRHYFETKQVKEAVAALQQLIAIDRNNEGAYDMLGQTYQSVGEYEQASRVYKNLAKVKPENMLARERLSTLQALRAQ